MDLIEKKRNAFRIWMHDKCTRNQRYRYKLPWEFCNVFREATQENTHCQSLRERKIQRKLCHVNRKTLSESIIYYYICDTCFVGQKPSTKSLWYTISLEYREMNYTTTLFELSHSAQHTCIDSILLLLLLSNHWYEDRIGAVCAVRADEMWRVKRI